MVFEDDYVAIAGVGLVEQGAEGCRWFAGGQWRRYNRARRAGCRSVKSRLKVGSRDERDRRCRCRVVQVAEGCRDAMRDEMKLG
jgi:hypothetical protein